MLEKVASEIYFEIINMRYARISKHKWLSSKKCGSLHLFKGGLVLVWNNYRLELGISLDFISNSAEHPLNQTSILLNKLGTWDLEVQILPLWKASVWAVFIPNQTFKISHQPKKRQMVILKRASYLINQFQHFRSIHHNFTKFLKPCLFHVSHLRPWEEPACGA